MKNEVYDQLIELGLTPGEAGDIVYMLQGEEEYEDA